MYERGVNIWVGFTGYQPTSILTCDVIFALSLLLQMLMSLKTVELQ